MKPKKNNKGAKVDTPEPTLATIALPRDNIYARTYYYMVGLC